MKIISLQIENLRKIKFFESEFTKSGLIQIRGKNAQGKTTILDAFEMLLKGKKSIPSDVVSHGKDKAKIVGHVGEYIIERVIGDKNKLKITNKDGLSLANKPQAFLDTLINELTFDPKPFLQKTPDQKLHFLMDLLELDFEKVDSEIKELEQERLFVGRQLKQFGKIEVVEKVEYVDVVDLVSEKDRLEKINREVVQLQTNKESFEQDLKKMKDELIDLRERIAHRENQLKTVSAQLSDKKIIDISDIQEKINTSKAINLQADLYIENTKKIKKKKGVELSYQSFTNDIEKLRSSKKQKLKETKMPVDGLEIREDGVYYNNIHCDNWSDAEALKISFELCISMKPKLNAVFIDKGESYDNEGLLNLRSWAIENDLQVFITIVDSGEIGEVKNAIYIEDGSMID